MTTTKNSLPAVKDGYYVVAADVKNPKPDRRSQSGLFREVWKAGTLVEVKAPADDHVGRIYFKDHSMVMFGGGPKSDASQRQGDGLLAHLTPADDTLGAVLRKEVGDPVDFLVVLLDSGKITIDDLRAAAAKMAAMDDPDDEPWFAEARRRHCV